ncbi:acyl-CoA synthetase (AMP-forming)/AMP-acid ligase II [Actinomadura coerulea]|uniref:Acyl-CoA synthetase (AMP-forming)/AMP-acid ligase II n=1 Tax=Actinomadura coerulea TaxID=46159 RepID=A0A7X0G3P0_9ACTN|nr:acyl-CoA synthetase (AMP-forming)/AMP-acid ligase II [Actinomadura coerulea]GGP99430.1 acyl-CoA synthetase [Actinomadura coerulea]
MPGLDGVLRERALAYPDRVAYIAGDTEISYRDFDRRVDRVAAALAAAGLGPGDRVAVLDKNSLEYAELLFGATRIGAAQVPVNYRLAPDEVAYIVNNSQAKVFVVGPEFLPVLDAIAGKLEHTDLTVVISGAGHAHQDYAAWIDAAPAEPPAYEPDSGDVFVQLYSSGTTGLPKGVMLTHDNFLSALAVTNDVWDIDGSSVLMIAMPMYHVAGNVLTVSAVYNGLTGVVTREPDPTAIAQGIERHRVTHIFLVPVLLQFMPLIPEVTAADMSSLRLMLYGASPISEDVLRTAMAMLPTTDFRQVYGLTEVTGAITSLPPGDHDPDGPNAHRLRSAGLPNDNTELRIVDPATGEELPAGRVGEIICRTPQNMKGYWGMPAATASALSEDNWFRTGDAGYLDEDGYLYIHDRVKDMIISGGENIYPAEVENVLMGHPAVSDCAVIGVPDERWGETPKAIVVASEDVSDQEIIDYCRERLAHFKCPTSVERREAIPRNPTGKILKRDLRAPYWQGTDRGVN